MLWELLLDAPTGSFKGFYLDEKGECECRFKDVTVDVEKVKEIQRGILNFVELYRGVSEKTGNLAKISGRDAYAAMVNVETESNRVFAKGLAVMLDDANVG